MSEIDHTLARRKEFDKVSAERLALASFVEPLRTRLNKLVAGEIDLPLREAAQEIMKCREGIRHYSNLLAPIDQKRAEICKRAPWNRTMRVDPQGAQKVTATSRQLLQQERDRLASRAEYYRNILDKLNSGELDLSAENMFTRKQEIRQEIREINAQLVPIDRELAEIAKENTIPIG